MYLICLLTVALIAKCGSSPISDDACLFSPCSLGQICVAKVNFGYECIDEAPRLLNFKPPVNFANTYEHDYDACISSPCSFGTICKSLPDNNYICLAEIDKSPQTQQARQIYKDIETLYASAIKDNLNNIVSSDQISVLKDRRKPVKNPCESSPCEYGYTCQLDEQFQDGFTCVQDPFDTIVQTENKIISSRKRHEYLQDKEFVHNVTLMCSTRELIDRLANPKNPNQFIVCLDDYEFSIMDCPDGLVFNSYLDRCDYTSERVDIGCKSSPCQYGAKCVDLDGDYRCECPAGFLGKDCEQAPDFCVSNPCGSNGQCHSLPYDSPVPYYCTCFDNKAFGVSCDQDSEPNPCLDDESELEAFATQLDQSIYIHCHEYNMYMKFCPRPLVFSEETQQCQWADSQ